MKHKSKMKSKKPLKATPAMHKMEKLARFGRHKTGSRGK